jgi:hypothetical protein
MLLMPFAYFIVMRNISTNENRHNAVNGLSGKKTQEINPFPLTIFHATLLPICFYDVLCLAVPLSENSIYAEVIKSEKGRNMTLDYVISVLVGLSSSPPFVRVVDNSYSIGIIYLLFNSVSFHFET